MASMTRSMRRMPRNRREMDAHDVATGGDESDIRQHIRM